MLHCRFLASLLILACYSITVSAADVQSDFTDQYLFADSTDNYQMDEPCRNFADIRLRSDWITKSHFKQGKGPTNQEIAFAETDFNASYNWCFNRSQGVYLGVGATRSILDWKQNPWFGKEDFNTINFSAGGFSKSCTWLWQGGVSAAVDLDNFDFSEYTVYNLTVWGRYTYSDMIGLHIGFTGWTGLKKTWALPILGIDFTLPQNWKINLVYPVNMGIVYEIDKCWSVALNGKLFNTRRRVCKSEILPQGIWQYRNAGVEFAVNYAYCEFFNANVHIGSTLGNGELQVSNSQGRNTSTYKFNGALYLGGAIGVKF